MSLNLIAISGNLGSDASLRQTQSGASVLSWSMAVNDRRKNSQTGEWEDYANFIDCTMFGTRAEAVSNYLSKGSKIGLEGKLRYSTWERDGQKRSKLEVIVDELEFLSPRNSQGGSGYQGGGYQGGGNYQNAGGYQGGNAGGYQPAPSVAPLAPAIDTASSVYDEDIPF